MIPNRRRTPVMLDPVFIRDALAILRRAPSRGAVRQAYARGVLVGVLAVFKALGWSQRQALAWCRGLGPPAAELNRQCIPPDWLPAWDAAFPPECS